MRVEPEQVTISSESFKRRHEVQTPPTGRVALVAAILAFTVFICLAVVWVTMNVWLRKRPFDADFRERAAIVAPKEDLLHRAPKPNLQMNPHTDLAAFRAWEDRELSSYGWINHTSGVIRIPIDRAMELLVERGLPVRVTNQPVRLGKSELELIREMGERR